MVSIKSVVELRGTSFHYHFFFFFSLFLSPMGEAGFHYLSGMHAQSPYALANKIVILQTDTMARDVRFYLMLCFLISFIL